MPARHYPPTADRLWARVSKSSGCWEWTGHRSLGPRSMGYGFIKDRGRERAVHRVSWELTRGPIPDGMFVLHTCDNPVCVRPDHLFLGTHQDNMDDKARKGRERGAVGEANAAARLTDAIVLDLRRRHRRGEAIAAMAAALGVHQDTVRNAVTGRNWRHLPDEVDVALFFADSVA